MLPILFLFFPEFARASTARSSVESEVQAGQAEIYQSVETTVNGVTVRKESRQPGKLELKMEQNGTGTPSVSFSSNPQPSISPKITSSKPSRPWAIAFVQNLLANLTSFLAKFKFTP